jgi:hypothetical protein
MTHQESEPSISEEQLELTCRQSLHHQINADQNVMNQPWQEAQAHREINQKIFTEGNEGWL